jgi:hypothetical protein
MTPPLRESESQQLREALRTPARLLVISLERRGIALRLSPRRRIEARGPLTDGDEAAIREHADAVKVLLTYRSHWCAWPQPVPRFDPSTAFLPAEAEHTRTA